MSKVKIVSNGGKLLNHALTAIKIGDTVYYKDSAKEVESISIKI